MPTREGHIAQARSNLEFLAQVNTHSPAFWDWQTTVCFYVGVHIINAHLAAKNQHFRTHVDVADCINPHKPMALCPVPEPVFVAYEKLSTLSRRSRYLLLPGENPKRSLSTLPRHFLQALENLDILLAFFSKTQETSFDRLSLQIDPDQKVKPLQHFQLSPTSA